MTWGERIRDKLIGRGVKLNPPASKDILGILLENCPILPSGFMEIYENFNGFSEGDFEVDSFVSVWPIERILSYSKKDFRIYIPFAGIEFDAVVLAVDLHSRGFPVVDLHEREYKSETFVSFFNELVM